MRSGTLSFAQTQYRVNEGDGNAVLTVNLDRSDDTDPGATVTVDYKTINGSATGSTTAGTPCGSSDGSCDFTSQDTTVPNGAGVTTPPNQAPLTFAPGVTSQTITVPINDDTAVENPESFSVILFNAQSTASATLANTTSTVTISDNDSTTSTVGFSSVNYSVNENPAFNPGHTSSATLTVVRQGDTTQTVTVNFSTAPETATADVDYQSVSGTIVFNPGETSKTITVPVFNDDLVEGDETFSVTLNPTFGGISTATVTIVDDDASTVNFSSSSYSVAENASNATISLLRTGNTNVGATVSVVTIAQTATADADYVTTARDVQFSAGQTATTFDVPIINDNQVEGTETFKISLSARQNSGFVIGQVSTTTVSIIDDESANTVEFAGSDFSVNENDSSGTARVAVQLNRRGDPNQTVSVQIFTGTGSATPNQDYTPISEASNTRLTFAPGETIKTVSIPIANDTAAENTETFGVVLANPTNAFLGATSTASVSILDDDSAGTLQFSSGTVGVFESDGFATLTVLLNRTGNTSAPVSAHFATVAGSAASNRFGQTSGTINFAAGTSVATISVPIINDTVIEPPQSFSVVLSNPVNASLGTPSSASVTIQDDDGLNTVEFDAADYGAVETTGAVEVRVRARRGGDPNQVLTVGISLGAEGDTAVNPDDYQTPANTTLTFSAGVNVQSISIPITDNPSTQGTKTFTVGLTNPGAFTSVGQQNSARVTIFDNSGPNTAQFLTSAQRFREGDQEAIAITVVRFGDFDRHGTNVTFTTEIRPGDTAQDGVNFTQTSGSIEFAALIANNLVVDNEHQKSIIIPIPNNTLIQGDVTFHVTLTGSDVGQLGSISTTQVTIADDDLGNVVQFSTSNYSVVENNGNAALAVQLLQNGDASRASSVKFAASPITAFAGFDFSPVTGTLTFAPGETQKTILIPINNDTISEGSETFRVTLSEPSPGTIIGNQSTATVTIIDDDFTSAVQFSPASYTVSETAGSVTLTAVVNRTGNPNDTLTVGFQTAGGTATENADYSGTSGTITFGPGETQKTITIPILNDNLIESTENFSVLLVNPGPGVSLSVNSTASVQIADDDNPNSSIGFSSPSFDVDEGAGFANLTVTRSGGLGVSATVTFSTANGTALAGTNYKATTGSVTFAVGEVSKTIQVPIIDDATLDPTLDFTVVLTGPDGSGFVGGQSTATVNIFDNDATVFKFDKASYTVDEGAGNVVLTVEAQRVGDPTDVITVDFVTTDGTAAAGTKYTRTSGRLTFDANVTTQTITVPITDESATEGNTTFSVTLSNPQGGNGANPPKLGTPSTSVVTIVDNDATTFQFSSSSYTATDSTGNATVTIVLSRVSNPDGVFTVDFATTDISAVAGRDYTATSGTLSFGAGETSKTVNIPLTPQESGQPTRQFRVDLSNPTGGAVLGTTSSTIVNISNPDTSTKPVNISTRGPVQTGDSVMIAGFIVQGNAPKRVIVRGIGPSLTALGVVGALQDTSIDLRDSSGVQLAFNDNWRTTQETEIAATNLAPGDDRESALVTTLTPGAYTVILRGTTNGIGRVDVFDLDSSSRSLLVNLSTRGKVETGDNGAMIGGFIIQGTTGQKVLIRAIGPSLRNSGVVGALLDPTLELYRGSQKILSNDNWKTAQQAAIQATGLAPSSDKESAILATLDPGSYTAVVRGKGNTTGVALTEVYQLQ